MDFSLSARQIQIKEEVLRFSKEELNAHLLSPKEGKYFDKNVWNKLGEQRLIGLCIPEEYGGRGYDPLTTVLSLEALGQGCEDAGLCFALSAHLLACTVPVWLHGTESQKSEFLPNFCDGTWVAANAMTESTSGSDVFSMNTVAVPSGNAFKMNGHKTYVSNGPIADVVVTYAFTNKEKGFFGGITGFLLNREEHAFHTSDPIAKMGLQSCLMGQMELDDVEVDHRFILGKVGGGGMIFNESMEWERICLGAIHLGAMQRVLDHTVKFVMERKSGGKPIGSNQVISHQLADLKVKLELARLITYKSACMLGKTRNLAQDAAMTKLFVCETFKEFSIKIFQIYGGQAYIQGHEVGALLQDAMSSTIYSGTSEVQRNIIAKTLGI